MGERLTKHLSLVVGMDNKRALTGMQRLKTSVSRGFKTMTMWAKRFALIGLAAIGAALIKVTHLGMNFQQMLVETGTVAGATAEEFSKLEATARQLGATTAFTATQAAGAMYNLASAGLTVTEIMKGTEAALYLAGATASDLGLATSAVAGTLRTFGLDASQTTRIADVLTKTVLKAQFRLEDLTEAMKYAAPAARAVGWSLEEAAAATVAFRRAGLQASMAGRYLLIALRKLKKPTDTAVGAFKALGISIEDLHPLTNSFSDILMKLSVINTDTIQSQRALAEAFGRAGDFMTTLIKNYQQGKLDLEAFTKMLEQSAGTAKTTYQKMMDTVKMQWRIVLSTLEELQLAIFDIFKTDLKGWFTKVAGTIRQWGNIIKGNLSDFKEIFRVLKEGFRKLLPDYKTSIDQFKAIGRVMVYITTGIMYAIAGIKDAFKGWEMIFAGREILTAEAHIKTLTMLLKEVEEKQISQNLAWDFWAEKLGINMGNLVDMEEKLRKELGYRLVMLGQLKKAVADTAEEGMALQKVVEIESKLLALLGDLEGGTKGLGGAIKDTTKDLNEQKDAVLGLNIALRKLAEPKAPGVEIIPKIDKGIISREIWEEDLLYLEEYGIRFDEKLSVLAGSKEGFVRFMLNSTSIMYEGMARFSQKYFMGEMKLHKMFLAAGEYFLRETGAMLLESIAQAAKHRAAYEMAMALATIFTNPAEAASHFAAAAAFAALGGIAAGGAGALRRGGEEHYGRYEYEGGAYREAGEEWGGGARRFGGTTVTAREMTINIQPSVSITGDTILIGTMGIEEAGETLGNLITQKVKDAIETGELPLQEIS